jgi:hypothetical protein
MSGSQLHPFIKIRNTAFFVDLKPDEIQNTQRNAGQNAESHDI